MSVERRAAVLTDDDIKRLLTGIDESEARAEQRRKDAVAIALLEERQRTTAESGGHNALLLSQHITECAKVQKWAFGVLIFVAGVVVTDSPKAEKLFGFVMEHMLP